MHWLELECVKTDHHRFCCSCNIKGLQLLSEVFVLPGSAVIHSQRITEVYINYKLIGPVSQALLIN